MSRNGRTSSNRVSQKFPGVSHYKDRHGKVRWRYREDGKTYNLGTSYGSPEFLRRYSAAVQGERLTAKGETAERTSQAPRGSLSHVIESWYKSPDFTRLGPTTQVNYRRIVEHLRASYGTRSVKGITRKVVKAIMDQKADKPEAANARLRILRLLLEHAKDHMEIIDTNPAKEVKKRPPNNTEGYYTWTEDDLKKYRDCHAPGSIAHLAMGIMLYTGASRADAVQLGPKNIVNGRLQYRRQKMKNRAGVLIDIPVHPNLLEAIKHCVEETFLATRTGSTRSAAGLGNLMRKWCDEAKLPMCSSHGLRKACARRIAEAGATPHEVMSVTGHKTLKEVERYTSKVTRAGLADRAMGRIESDKE